jgi:Ca2+-binding EF-hand superfamily protein
MEDIFRMCSQLDNDGNGTITLDEFLYYFQHLDTDDLNDFERRSAEEELYENIWPDWVIKDGKIDSTKQILLRMYDAMRKTPNISPEQAFQIFDQREKGLISAENFRKILTMFFADAKLEESEIEFILKLTPKTVDQQYMYREFCKFLDKRFVRTFKLGGNNAGNTSNTSFSLTNDLKDSYLRELDQVLTKEASLNYVIRKSTDLNLDLRAIFIKNDESGLSVIPRARFWRILESLPLGLLPFELEEIFDSDLNYDNYGNVDYTVILNSDIFVTLERQRIRRQHKKQESFDLDVT